MTKFALMSDPHYGHSGGTENKIRKMFTRLQKENPDVIICAGDIASTCQYQYKRFYERLREYFPLIPVLAVRGNHDFWDGVHKKDKSSGLRSLGQIYQYHDDVHKFCNIHHLDEPYEINGVTVFGYDGWYASANPPSNDELWIPKDHQSAPSMSYLCSKSFKDFDTVLEKYNKEKTEKNILVSHFPSVRTKNTIPELNGSRTFYPEIVSRFDIVCNGHTHQLLNDERDETLFLNCGPDYNKPTYLIFEL